LTAVGQAEDDRRVLRYEEERPPRTSKRTAPAPSQQVPASIAELLGLQRSAGNLAVARRLVQRVPVQGRITPGAQGHHPKYEYDFGGGQFEGYELDKWITSKATTSPLGYAPQIPAQTITPIVQAWDGSNSIFTGLNTALIGSPVWGPRTDGEPGKETTVDVPAPVAQSPAGQAFAKHFLTLQENVALRVADIAANVPQTITVLSKNKKGTDKKAFTPSWTNILKGARIRLKAELLARSALPATKELVRLLDQEVLNSTDAALVSMRSMGLIVDEAGEAKFKKKAVSGQKLERAAHTATFTPENITFNFGLNHLSFIVYLEWRAMSELAATGAT
jgi:hypothetical protein